MAPPPLAEEWDVRFASQSAAAGWEDLCRQAPANTRACFDGIRADPQPAVRTHRHHPLRREFAAATVGGRRLPQWQYEVTAGGRVWYAVDEEKLIVWLTYASPRHPRATNRR